MKLSDPIRSLLQKMRAPGETAHRRLSGETAALSLNSEKWLCRYWQLILSIRYIHVWLVQSSCWMQWNSFPTTEGVTSTDYWRQCFFDCCSTIFWWVWSPPACIRIIISPLSPCFTVFCLFSPSVSSDVCFSSVCWSAVIVFTNCNQPTHFAPSLSLSLCACDRPCVLS